MRDLCLISMTLCLFAPGCSDSNEDPLASKCESVCSIDSTHPCYDNGKGVQECVQKCRNVVGGADKNPAYMKGCAECIAEQFKYALKPGCTETSTGDCCYPGYVIQPNLDTPNDPGWQACEAKCIEPDGGIGY
jgi:hypothetical protein